MTAFNQIKRNFRLADTASPDEKQTHSIYIYERAMYNRLRIELVLEKIRK